MTESIKVEEKCKPSFEKHCALWGYKTDLDGDGFYVDSLTQRVFNAYYDAWQASRAAVVVSLPEPMWGESQGDEVVFYDSIKNELERLGVSYE